MSPAAVSLLDTLLTLSITPELTSEEVTALRRIERKATKHVKKLEREAEKLLAASAAASERGSSIGTPLSSTSDATLGGDGGEDVAVGTVGEDQLAAKLDQIVEEQAGGAEAAPEADAVVEEKEIQEPPPLWHLGAEHTQLQPEEAFFLLFSLGSLSLTTASPYTPDSTSPPLSILSAWQLFLRDSAILLQPLSSPTAGLKLEPKDDPRLSRFDSPFLIAYASYHHFRSMGWVVRSGVKFCCEWVLYGQGGPVGGHAEWVLISLAVSKNLADALCGAQVRCCRGTQLCRPSRRRDEPLPLKPGQRSPRRRRDQDVVALVQHDQPRLLGRQEGNSTYSPAPIMTLTDHCSLGAQTLVLLHVLIPPQSSLPSPNFLAENPAQAIAMLQMREVTIRRFLAGRSRD